MIYKYFNKQVILPLILFLLILFIGHPFLHARLADTPWPCSGGNAQRSGLSRYNTSRVDGTLLWELKIPGKIFGSSASTSTNALSLDSNNYLYVATFFHGDSFDEVSSTLYSIDLNQKSTEAIFATEKGTALLGKAPTISAEGNLFIPSYHYPGEALLYALDNKGNLVWTFNTHFDFLSSPIIDAHGNIFICSSYPGSRDNNEKAHQLFALKNDGTLKWSKEIGTNKSGPAIDKSGNLVIAGHQLYALTPQGQTLWTYPLDNAVTVGPIISPDGTVYVAETYEGKLHALDSWGNKKWEFQADKTAIGMPAVFSINPSLGPDGTLYIFSADNREGNQNLLYAIDPSGALKWTYKLDNIPDSNIAIGAEGTIYFANGNRMVALSSKGQELWSHKDDRIDSALDLVIGFDGTIYLCSSHINHTFLFAFGNQSDPSIETVEGLKAEEVELELSEEALQIETSQKEFETTKPKDEASPLAVLYFLVPALGILIALGIFWVKRRKQLNDKQGKAK